MFRKFSPKQVLINIWWQLPKFKHIKMIILNGAIRTGKTLIGFLSFYRWGFKTVLKTKDHDKSKGWSSFLVVGATRDTVRENIIDPFCETLTAKKYIQVEKMSQLKKYKYTFFHNSSSGRVYVKYNKVILRYKYVGANNKRSVISIQGGTYRGIFIDEAGLIPMSAIENAISRTVSFKDALIWQTTNPEGDEEHEYYQTYIKGAWHKKILVLTFELLDNPEMTQEDVEWYRKVFTTSMFLRKVLGKWVKGIGGIFQNFRKEDHGHDLWNNYDPDDYVLQRIGIDYGESDATTYEFMGIKRNLAGLDFLNEYYHRNSETSYKNIEKYCDDFFTFVDEINAKQKEVYPDRRLKMIEIWIDSANLTVKNYFKSQAAARGYKNIAFANVNKTKRLSKSHSELNEQQAIKERCYVWNLMLGAMVVRIDKFKCKRLMSALSMAVWGKDGNRLDDNTLKFNPVDVLDAAEYSWLDLIKKMVSRIVYVAKLKRDGRIK